MKKTKFNNVFKTTIKILFIPGLLLIVYILISEIKLFFADVDQYVNNSTEIDLINVTAIANIREGYGFGTGSGIGKQTVTITDGTKYYNLTYYEKNKSDKQFYFFDEKKIPSSISIAVNKDDIQNGKGTMVNPIPVFNFSTNKNEMLWDDESYRENIRHYLAFEK